MGSMMSLNMQGWGLDVERATLWSMLARTKTMIIVLIDHRQKNTRTIEFELKDHWTGVGVKKDIRFAHVKPGATRSGGITIAIHPILARYAEQHHGEYDDPRNWG